MPRASSTPTNASKLGRKAKAAIGVLLVLVSTEIGLRIVFFVFARVGHHDCGVRPERLGRLLFAYSRSRTSPDSPEVDGTIPDPHRGHRHAPNLRDRPLHDSIVSTNSRGLRGTREYEVPKPPSVVRIVALGDSFTFGDGVPDDATWPAQLERAMPSVEVANLGERAYGHDQMYFALQDEGTRLQPDAVILGYYQGDGFRDELTFYCFEKPRFSLGPSGWHVENVPVPAPWQVHDRYLAVPLLYELPRVLAERADVPPQTFHTGEVRAAEILRETAALATSAGARFVMVNLPEKPGDLLEGHHFFDAWCARTHTECVDTSSMFQLASQGADPDAARARFHLPNNIHYSREGYAVVAEAVRAYFAEHPVAPRERP